MFIFYFFEFSIIKHSIKYKPKININFILENSYKINKF